MGKLKQEGKIKAIIATGCMAERYKEQIREQMPEVDGVIGIGANAEIAQVVQKALQGENPLQFPDKLNMPMNGGRIQSTQRHYAYLKVADGCDNCCTYCAIPLIRGRFRSRKIEDLVAEAKYLAEGGVKELIVIAQDTTRYGEDIYGKLMLPELLRELCKIEELHWVRMLYCYPDRITDELLDCMAENDKIVNYIDLPLQHCNGDILKAMNRQGNKESLTQLIDKIKTRLLNVILRTTLIVGFPGETQEQFEELSQFVQDVKFQRLGCFTYSPEEDTKAALMPDQIDEETKQRRMEIIMEQQRIIMEEYCNNLQGKTIEVVTEGFDKLAECFYGRSAADSPDVDGRVFFTAVGRKPVVGEFVKVQIDDYLDCDPIGTMVD